MFRFALASTLATAQAQDEHPHLAQAWQALSSGDGLPGQVGLESYIYEDCPKNHWTEECMSGHVFDYGADNCIKYEVNMGLKSKYTGTYYVKCDAVDCCKDDSPDGDVPDVKKWDIGQGKKSAITQMEATDLDDLDGHVAGADTWLEDIKVLGAHVKYTYYITQSENGDVISHAIDYEAPGTSPGRILYGNFTVKHADELDAFREVFKAPEACLKPNTLSCSPDTVKKWGRKSPPVASPPAATTQCADVEDEDHCTAVLLEGLCGAPAVPGNPSTAEVCMLSCGCCSSDTDPGRTPPVPPAYCPGKEAVSV